ncbi:GNAT family N-acetyltransferase [Flavimaricola marinus]|uniref:Acetyltransferase (GNAT) family protein n=1 Tax=Flavimaricola marinus TaxID=1819565 RepID=A0A238LC62_9RHOB|nr:GNAT family N-acetyltransferase [Flavimaricola marinus]SMY07218.1 Acetyltransferase (GNAT) family protein [Flavimaricola marinus]
MTVITRPGTSADAKALVGIINPIIGAGGTTAHQTPFDEARITRHYIAPEQIIRCTVAELNGKVSGFQTLMWPDEEGDSFPEGWAIIASFVAQEAAGNGIGRALFEATKVAALAAGVTTIDATIRADNAGGLAYYSSLGFVDYEVLAAVPLRDGTLVDRVRKRLDLD